MNDSHAKSAELIKGGKPYFESLLTDIQKAAYRICILTYIYEEDETGQMIELALEKAAQKGVQVYLMADGYASQKLSHRFRDQMVKSGIIFKFFEPIFKSKHFYFGRRLHQKAVLIDGSLAFIGGVNFSNHYNDLPNKKAWLDFAVRVHGSIVQSLEQYFWEIWGNPPSYANAQTSNFKPQTTSLSFNKKQEPLIVSMAINDWITGKKEITNAYKEMLRGARKEVLILCSYFLPGTQIRKEIMKAAKRGIRLKIVTAGPSDVPLAKHAERWLYDWMLRYGIEIYEYQHNILHGKIAVCDATWMTIGSYNVNNISAYASLELNLNIKNEAFALMTKNTIEKIIQEECMLITRQQHLRKKNLIKQLGRWFSFQLIRMIFKLCTFYFKQQPY
jgi:cardiolipin synthase